MKHYGIIQWVDFARHVVTGEEEVRMRDHLSAGCAECLRLLEFCNTVYETSRGIAPEPVPDWVVRSAKALARFALRPEEKASAWCLSN